MLHGYGAHGVPPIDKEPNMPNDINTTPATPREIPAAMWSYDFHGTSVDIKSLPEASVLAMVRRGLSHYAGNELASKVAGFKERTEKEQQGTPATEEQVATYKATAAATMLAALTSGTIGVRAGGGGATRVADPVEREARRIAVAEVEGILKAKGLKMPTGDKTITFANGTFTREDLISRRLAGPEGDRIQKAAKKAVSELAKVAGNAANVDISQNDSEALGL